jgi:hypothetical protein
MLFVLQLYNPPSNSQPYHLQPEPSHVLNRSAPPFPNPVQSTSYSHTPLDVYSASSDPFSIDASPKNATSRAYNGAPIGPHPHVNAHAQHHALPFPTPLPNHLQPYPHHALSSPLLPNSPHSNYGASSYSYLPSYDVRTNAAPRTLDNHASAGLNVTGNTFREFLCKLLLLYADYVGRSGR